MMVSGNIWVEVPEFEVYFEYRMGKLAYSLWLGWGRINDGIDF